MNAYEFYFKSISGTTLPLSMYQGQPLLIANTASECGFTPQYQKLQMIWNALVPTIAPAMLSRTYAFMSYNFV